MTTIKSIVMHTSMWNFIWLLESIWIQLPLFIQSLLWATLQHCIRDSIQSTVLKKCVYLTLTDVLQCRDQLKTIINFKILVQVKIVLMQASCKVTMGHSSLVVTTNEQIIWKRFSMRSSIVTTCSIIVVFVYRYTNILSLLSEPI